MKRLLILAVLGMLMTGLTGCRFMECLFRGPACQQQQQAPTTVIASPCANPCETPCSSPCATTTVVTPGPETTYTPAPTR